MTEVQKALILAGLEPLIVRAEKTGMWLRSSYQDIWFTPKELRAEQAQGRFVWDVVNWSLGDPKELIADHRRRIDGLTHQIASIEKRMTA